MKPAEDRVVKMEMDDFHDSEFDESTLLKLDIFGGYIKEWLPVFLSKRTYPEIHIYDFFCGAGSDAKGRPGSPIRILDELDEYVMSSPTSSEVSVHIHFNDSSEKKISRLQSIVAQRPSTWTIDYTCLDFSEAFERGKRILCSPRAAKLIILDQFGVKEVSEKVFGDLISLPTTDMLFFLSSSYIRRFYREPSIRKYLPMDEEQFSAVPHKEVHRYICKNFYRKLIPTGFDYYVAPFSIRKGGGSNIYGIIFGSSRLLGLDKFLQVCWKNDEATGEANYNIDDDIVRDGQLSLLAEFDVVKKHDRFEKDLIELVCTGPVDNRQMYQFTLENGFLPKHLKAILNRLQKSGQIAVTELVSGKPAKPNAYYANKDNYELPPRVVFSIKDTGHGSK